MNAEMVSQTVLAQRLEVNPSALVRLGKSGRLRPDMVLSGGRVKLYRTDRIEQIRGIMSQRKAVLS